MSIAFCNRKPFHINSSNLRFSIWTNEKTPEQNGRLVFKANNIHGRRSLDLFFYTVKRRRALHKRFYSKQGFRLRAGNQYIFVCLKVTVWSKFYYSECKFFVHCLFFDNERISAGLFDEGSNFPNGKNCAELIVFFKKLKKTQV